MIGKYCGDQLKKSQAGQEYTVSVFEVEGKPKNLSKSKKFNGTLELGKYYELETWQAEGKKTVYLNSVKVVEYPKEPASTPEYKGTVSGRIPADYAKVEEKLLGVSAKDKAYSDGQARGNYRNCITQFIIAKDLASNVEDFNKLLKRAEINYFSESDDSVEF